MTKKLDADKKCARCHRALSPDDLSYYAAQDVVAEVRVCVNCEAKAARAAPKQLDTSVKRSWREFAAKMTRVMKKLGALLPGLMADMKIANNAGDCAKLWSVRLSRAGGPVDAQVVRSALTSSMLQLQTFKDVETYHACGGVDRSCRGVSACGVGDIAHCMKYDIRAKEGIRRARKAVTRKGARVRHV